MARRKIYPIPVEGLIDNPEALTLPAAAYGMLWKIILHFWATECRALPVADHELRCISRGHAPTWSHWKSTILGVFETIRPDLEAAQQARENRVNNLIRLSQRSTSLRVANALRSNSGAPMHGQGSVTPSFPKRSEATRVEKVQRPGVSEHGRSSFTPNRGFVDGYKD